jgi:hypothetical protein
MGKVGTSSIISSANLEESAHIHFLDFEKHLYNFTKWNSNKSDLDKALFKRRTFVLGLIFRIRKKKVITIFRDPYVRNISLVFEELINIIKYNGYSKHGHKNLYLYNSSSDLVDGIYINHLRKEIPFVWFRDEFEITTKINIFDYPFDKEKGFSLIKKGNIEVLLLTLEKINLNEKVISEFINQPYFKLKHQNNSSKKWYSDLYDDFKQKNKLTVEELSFYYDNDVVKYFYTTEQIEEFKKKWSKI